MQRPCLNVRSHLGSFKCFFETQKLKIAFFVSYCSAGAPSSNKRPCQDFSWSPREGLSSQAHCQGQTHSALQAPGLAPGPPLVQAPCASFWTAGSPHRPAPPLSQPTLFPLAAPPPTHQAFAPSRPTFPHPHPHPTPVSPGPGTLSPSFIITIKKT